MNRLKILRCEKGLVQKDISDFLHCSISMYEREKRVMDDNTIQKLANFFECSIDYFLGYTNIRNDKEFIINTYSIKEPQDEIFLCNYHKLNEIGKLKINEIIIDLLQIHKYTKELNES